MAKVQATVLATCAPLANFSVTPGRAAANGEARGIHPEVINLTQDTLVLIGNASN